MRNSYDYSLSVQLFVIIALGFISVVYPSNESEKPLVLLHLLLSYTLFQLLIADTHPTSNTPPLLGLYIMASMAVAAFHLLTACIILRIHNSSHDTRPPHIIRVVLIRPVLKLLAGIKQFSRKLSRTRKVDFINRKLK